MKKVKFEGKLSLNKEAVAKLNKAQMRNIKGGECTAAATSCTCGCPPPPTYIGCGPTVGNDTCN